MDAGASLWAWLAILGALCLRGWADVEFYSPAPQAVRFFHRGATGTRWVCWVPPPHHARKLYEDCAELAPGASVGMNTFERHRFLIVAQRPVVGSATPLPVLRTVVVRAGLSEVAVDREQADVDATGGALAALPALLLDHPLIVWTKTHHLALWAGACVLLAAEASVALVRARSLPSTRAPVVQAAKGGGSPACLPDGTTD